jgi:hypothetical protein
LSRQKIWSFPSKRFFGVPTFFNYAIADGLYSLLNFIYASASGRNAGKKSQETPVTFIPVELKLKNYYDR